MISNGNSTEWSPIRSVITRVIYIYIYIYIYVYIYIFLLLINHKNYNFQEKSVEE